MDHETGELLTPGYTEGAEAPIVTIVVSFRERWRFTPLTVESVLANTEPGYALWLLDSGIPPAIRAELAKHVESGAVTIIDVGAGTQPSDARAMIASRLKSRYAVFLDNDAIVRPGWLEKLVDCAETTGAGIVCPLYLWGDTPDTDKIHMAGGNLTITRDREGLRMEEVHRHIRRRLPEVEPELEREKCDFGEYHCLMMRREVYSATGMFHPEIVSVHEHLHASLLARELGYETWFEPESRVSYLAYSQWLVSELPEFRKRWGLELADRSQRGFAQRWGVIDDARYRGPLVDFLRKHHGLADVLDPRPRLGARRTRTFDRANLQQTCAGLEWLAIKCGCGVNDTRVLARAYRIALELVDGLYRPCGRPFINHLTGTASVLLYYGCTIDVVLAGLFHAVFTHGQTPQSEETDQVIADRIGTLGSAGEHAVKMAKRHAQRVASGQSLTPGRDPADLSVEDAETWLIEAANDLDMHLSFEVPFTARSDILTGDSLDYCRVVLGMLELPGMAKSLTAVRGETVEIPTVSFAQHNGSFRFEESGALISATRGTRPPSS